jgi:peptide/nickel transport system substrate-binding protein
VDPPPGTRYRDAPIPSSVSPPPDGRSEEKTRMSLTTSRSAAPPSGGARRRLTCLAAGTTAMALSVTLAGCAGGNATAHGHKSLSALTIADTGFPASMDPATGQNANNQYYDLAYDPLIIHQVDGSYAPGLATAWAYGPKNESFSFTLRSGVRFSDGTVLDSAAVKTWIRHELKVPGGTAHNYLGSLTGIETPDTTHVKLTFSKPTPQLPFVFSQELEMGMIGSPRAVSAGTLATKTDGAGQYVLDQSATVNGDHYTYTPNPHYWNPKAIHWKKIVIRYITSPTTTLQAMRSGQVQLAVQQQVSSIGAAKRAGLTITQPLQAFFGLSIDDRTGSIVPALKDPRVRQAINYAVNRPAINKSVFGGFGQPNDQVAIPGDDGYNPTLASRYPYDPTKARKLLAEAGYPHGFTMRILDMKALGFDTLAQAIAGQLQNVGIKAEPVDAANRGDYFGKLASGKYETSILGFGGLPGYFLYGLLLGPGATQFNPLKTRSSVLDSAYRSLLPLSTAAAKPYARKMVGYVTEQAWFAPVVSTPFLAFSTKDIAGMEARTDGRRLWYLPNVRPAK